MQLRSARPAPTDDDKMVPAAYRFSVFVKRGEFDQNTLIWLSAGEGGAGYFVTDLSGCSLNNNEIRVSQAKVERCLAAE